MFSEQFTFCNESKNEWRKLLADTNEDEEKKEENNEKSLGTNNGIYVYEQGMCL